MLREPEWQALADIQFLIYKRVADSLNAALSAVALSDIPGAGGQSPAYWRERATTKVSSVLNLFTAWEYLLRYKMGETIPERAIRPFQVNTLLAWLSHQLQLSVIPVVEGDPLLHANQETLQEALLLLYSAAFTQGANVRLEVESQARGMWFRVKFSRVKPLPATFDEMLVGFGDHWRARDTVFELSMARDFIRLNGSELLLNSSDHHGEFVFYVWREGVKRGPLPSLESTQTPRSGTGPLQPGASRSATQQSSVTQVIAESDLLGGATRPISRPVSRPITSELKPAENTPVLKPPFGPEASEPVPPRLAEVQPAHFPLPPTVFGPDTHPGVTPKAGQPAPAVPGAPSPSPDKQPLREPRLADNVSAPTPHAPELPEPGTVAPRAPITEAGPVMVGPTPAPTPRLDEMLSVQSVWASDSSASESPAEPSGDTADAKAEPADPNSNLVLLNPEPAEDHPGPVDHPGLAASDDSDPSAKSV